MFNSTAPLSSQVFVVKYKVNEIHYNYIEMLTREEELKNIRDNGRFKFT